MNSGTAPSSHPAQSSPAPHPASIPRTRWGRTSFAPGIPAPALAVPIGLLLGAGTGFAAAWFRFGEASPWLVGVVFACATAVPFMAGAWALLVDRATLHGVVEHTEESIESTWVDKATQGAFTDTLTFTGLALAVVAVAQIDVSGMVALIAVIVVAFSSQGIRYLVARRRG